MFEEYSKKILNKIEKSLLKKEFLKKHELSAELLSRYLTKKELLTEISLMVEEQDYTCKRILNLCLSIMLEISKGKEPDDWLNYIYQLTLSKSFPNTVEIDLEEDLNKASYIYLEFLRVFSKYQNFSDDGSFQSKYPFEFLNKVEESNLEDDTEYKKFRHSFRNDYVYEMMKLNREVIGYSTLEHVCGVHYLAMRIGRQLKDLGLQIDLGRVSGAAAGHDIGKFGCRPEESHRVAYYHYYYTGQWFDGRGMPYIRNVAINHSTWDLELENLAIESLILIYSDFCVKAPEDPNHTFKMKFYSLSDAFQVILDKLDNVDEVKEKRYRRVYSKLKDFEDFMKDKGIELDVEKEMPDLKAVEIQRKHYSLMQGNAIIQNLKYLAINHNIGLMHVLRDESSLNAILENARSRKDINNLRGYIFVLEEYCTYLTPKQKMTTMKFLYERLSHPEEDIRKQCAELLGTLIANYDEEYRKELPKNVVLNNVETTSMELLKRYLDAFLYPDQKTSDRQAKWIGHSLANMLKSLFKHSKKEANIKYVERIVDYFRVNKNDEQTDSYLLEVARIVPLGICSDATIVYIGQFVKSLMLSENIDLKIHAYNTIEGLLPYIKDEVLKVINIIEILDADIENTEIPALNISRYNIAELVLPSSSKLKMFKGICLQDYEKVSELYLSNLKAATSAIIKRKQIQILYKSRLENKDMDPFYTAMHFCNLLKVSAYESVRNCAGETLIKLIPLLTVEQRNDIVVELWKALEIERYQFTKYIPAYLGRVLLHLKPFEIDELLLDISDKVKKGNTQITQLLLKTIGVSIVYFDQLIEVDSIDSNGNGIAERKKKMIGILLNGLVHYEPKIHRTAISVLGKDIFGTNELSLEEKKSIFILVAKKILTIVTDINMPTELTSLSYSAGLNHVYRFISDFNHFFGDIKIVEPKKIAFFPGAFDPFSLAHKESANEIRDKGFEVYLAIDEFSWSKRTQPNMIRRQIIKMSIAEEFDIYTYPRDLPVNIANNCDLADLRGRLPNADVHIVVGSDVIANASAYETWEKGVSIHSFSHIIFERLESLNEDVLNRLNSRIDLFEKNIVRLVLSKKYETISSTKIRNYIDKNRDISELIDPLVQKYIYNRGLYKREPQYKEIMTIKSVSVEIVEVLTDHILLEVSELSNIKLEHLKEKLRHKKYGHSTRILTIRSLDQGNKLIGFSLFHWLRASMIYNEFENKTFSDYIQNNSVGRIIVIDGIFAEEDTPIENIYQALLTETLAFCLSKDYSYTVFRNIFETKLPKILSETLRLQGFNEISVTDDIRSIYVVNMSSPCTFTFDIRSMLKEPYRRHQSIVDVANKTGKQLQIALTKLYPGDLVLAFDRMMIYEHLINKVCEVNKVTTSPEIPRKLGEHMCVPYGDIFKRWILPNTVTKAFHTERYYATDTKSYDVLAYPNYLPIETQAKTMRSFNRKAILVDDLLDKGYRLQAIDKVMEMHNVGIEKIVVAILSGRGKALMEDDKRKVESAYFIPRLKVWFNESHLYPFIGGDSLWRGVHQNQNALPSVNLIMPYTFPSYIRGTSNNAIYNFSKVCLENAIEILEVIESVYLEIHERNLTLGQLSEVMISPRYPDKGSSIRYDQNQKPSHYIKNDLEHLLRFGSMYE